MVFYSSTTSPACSFRKSLLLVKEKSCSQRGEALLQLLSARASDGTLLFDASSNVVVDSDGENFENTSSSSLGIFANNDDGIKTNEKIFALKSELYHPLSSAFATRSATTKAPQFVEAARRVAPGFEVHASMALNLLLDSSSYRASCPPLTGRMDPSVPLLWEASTQVALLRGTPTFESVVTRKTFVKNAHAGIFGEENKAVPYDLFAWALSTVLSRALSVSSSTTSPSKFYSFIPGVDLLNHDANANCEIRLVSSDDNNNNKTADTVEVHAIRDIKNGEECTISYGNQRSNDELLRKYGFCVPNNPNDFIQVRLQASNTFLKVDRKTIDEICNDGQKQEEFVSKYDARDEVLDAVAEQKAALDEVAEREPALKRESGKKWLEAIRTLREGQYEILNATERAFR
jgi:hypothetical protein